MVWYCLVLTTTSQFSFYRNHLSIVTISSIDSPRIVPKHSNSPVTGSSQQILYATIVEIPSIHPKFLSESATPPQELHLSSKHTAKLTRRGQVESKIVLTVASLKTISGNFKFFKEMVSPSSENIQLLHCDPSNSAIMIDIFLFRYLGYNSVGFFQRNPKEPDWLEDSDIIQNLQSKLVGYQDYTLLLLSIEQRGSIFLKSCSSLIFIASAIEMRLDFLIIDSLLGTLKILMLPLPFHASLETSLSAGIYSRELLGELFTISFELEFDTEIEFLDLHIASPISACAQSKTT